MIKKISLAHTPTPVVSLPRLSARWGGPEILLKRDDLTGLAFGGNKTRKLEYLVADARDKSADILITTGAAQSNHCRQTAAAAARQGLDCLLVLTGKEPVRYSGNNFLDRLLGAKIVWTSPAERDETLHRQYEVLEKDGRSPYLIPYGGSNALGAFAYAMAVEELMAQMGQEFPDWIVFATSSGGTQAGLLAGANHFGLRSKILGISVDETASGVISRISDLAEKVSPLLGFEETYPTADILVNDDYIGEGYGVMGELEKTAVKTFAREEGILLDPVYTGRAAGGMMDLVQGGFFAADSSVLFWHTGGTPALYADSYQDDIVHP